MSTPDNQLSSPDRNIDYSRGIWKEIIVPTAKSLEGFFWRLAWFGLLLAFLYCCMQTKNQPIPQAPNPDHKARLVEDQLDDFH